MLSGAAPSCDLPTEQEFRDPAELLNRESTLGWLGFRPVVVLMAFKAAAFRGILRAWAMALLARLDSGQENIGGVMAGGRASVARGAGHHAVRVMINSACDSQRAVMFDFATSGSGLLVGVSMWHCLQVLA